MRLKRVRLMALIFSLGIALSSCGENEDSLQELASFTPPKFYKKVSLNIRNYCPQGLYTLRNVFADIKSARIDEGGNWILDSDADGVSDNLENQFEFELGIDPFNPRSTNTGLRDHVIYYTKFMVDNHYRLGNCFDGNVPNNFDSDFDGLLDCEEDQTNTDESLIDSDSDGIPDGLEVKYGFDTQNGEEASKDPDNDGIVNIEEVKKNTPHLVHNSQEITAQAIQYDQRPVDGQPGCYHQSIHNVPVLDIGDPDGDGMENLVEVLFIEGLNTDINAGQVDLKIYKVIFNILSTSENGSTITVEYEDERYPVIQ